MELNFWIVAGLMTVVATALLVYPLIAERAVTQVAVSIAVLVLTVPLASTLLYTRVSTDPGESATSSAVPPVEKMVSGLAERLAAQPDDLEGWLMLGRSYVAIGRYDDAVAAYERAMALTDGTDAQAALGFAEALILADRNAVLGDAGDIVERVLAESPDNPRALWYGGLVAAARQQNERAADRWQRLLDTNPEPQIREFLIQQLAGLGETAAPQGPESAAAPAAGPPALRIDVAIAGEFSDKVPRGATMFVLARDAKTPGGPPIAVRRIAVEGFPFSIELSDANAMVPGRSLSQPTQLRIVARVSASGTATSAPGDIFGETVIDSKPPANVSILIDTLVE
jgi:cytochrome c-type biogenesis protein CcmH